MFSLTPSLDQRDAASDLERLLSPSIDPAPFLPILQRLARMSAAFVASCPPPWPAPALMITPEIHCRSECWLPLAEIRPAFQRFYRAALRHAPVLQSTPFADAASWAAVVAGFPRSPGWSSNPAILLEQLLADADTRAIFLFWSFMPGRFYGGGCDRYPEQAARIAEWLGERNRGRARLRCLDAACGDGAGTYGLARLLLEQGWRPEEFELEGWTIDPLEVWAAAHAGFPHDSRRQAQYREWTAPVFAAKARSSILFETVDLLGQVPPFAKGEARFDLILCNGLLGGPIINQPEEMRRIVGSLAALLRPGGLLLAADRFHGGWKRQIPKENLGDLFKGYGLIVGEAGEGIAGIKNP